MLQKRRGERAVASDGQTDRGLQGQNKDSGRTVDEVLAVSGAGPKAPVRSGGGPNDAPAFCPAPSQLHASVHTC